MSKSNSIPEHIDAPSSSYFAVGVASLEKPFEGDDVLKVLKQDFASIDGTFPSLGDAHPDKSGFFLFHITPEQNIGGGILKATCFYSSITNSYTKKIRQSVNFYGVRQRSITFSESYKTIKRIQKQNTSTINGTTFIIPYIEQKEVMLSRDLKASDIVAREPFSEEVTCTQHIEFYNLAVKDLSSIDLEEKLLIKDTNKSIWRKSIDEAYEAQKHQNSVKIGSYPQAPTAFSDKTGTNYLSETSSPSADWYAGKLGKDGYIVQPTNIEPYYAGKLVKVDWITTAYR
jgi:hypothetical protein